MVIVIEIEKDYAAAGASVITLIVVKKGYQYGSK
jgi:hypothetical protein